jgi:hypothetical protein
MNKEHVSEYNKKYRIQNKEKVRLLQADYYEKHRLERIINANNWRLNHPEHYKATRKAYMDTPIGRMTSVKGSAKTRNIEYLLTDEVAISILSLPCYYCGNTERQSGIDRTDSNLGYIEGNCVPSCPMCNYMKRTYGKDEFIAQCKLVSKHHS